MSLTRLLFKRLISSRNRKHLKEGRPQLACFAFDLITTKIHVDGRFEDRELSALETLVFPFLPRDGICLDIGANIGNHAVAFSRHFRHVHAFEPNPNVFRLLDINATLCPNVTAWHMGLSDREDTIEVVEERGNVGATAINGTPRRSGGNRVAFQLVTLDSHAPRLGEGRITFVKLDVEGHEPEVIAGARQTLARHRPVVGFESLRDNRTDGDCPTLQMLREAGYVHFHEIRRGALPGSAPRLVKLAAFKNRNYPMLIASMDPLPGT